ncbi:MAG: thiol-disulfide oxidoreductase DCC family protein [Ignavibacteriaceae bacterium]
MINKKFRFIILFDGVCNFCNFWVNFIIDRDPEMNFGFIPLQSQKGKEYLNKFGLSTSDFDTFVLIENEKCYVKSTAGLIVARHIKGFLKLLFPFIIIPAFLRDPVYDLIAKNRYKFFGKTDACRIPAPEDRERFL